MRKEMNKETILWKHGTSILVKEELLLKEFKHCDIINITTSKIQDSIRKAEEKAQLMKS